ncbi:MarR family transcriptional regulator [Agreia pratensis]|uniref:sugar-binding transcriptional regulator n=1 Tax=Agreia pratensis TaxID=150121 RepID=UPI00188AF3ED|nr:sugar-binding domain-containing protein [Agreia pratensis]MBF4633001.1 MarR family transcriptional regulator [Agreia pratensis]
MTNATPPGRAARRADDVRFSLDVVYQAARMYYLEDATQVEIAARLDVSRPTVSRLIAEARRLGLVHITVVDPFLDETIGLADALRDALGLRSVHLAAVTHASTLGRDLAAPVAAAIAGMELEAGDALLMSLGRTVHDLARSGMLPPLPGVTIVPAVGGQAEPQSWFQTNEITRMAAEATGARSSFLFAQTLPSPAMRVGLDADPAFMHVMELWHSAKGALLGIGAPTATRHVLSSGLPDDEGVFDDAAGDVCLNFFRADGSALEFPGSERMVRVPRATLEAMPHAVGVAVGLEKTASIIGAVRGSLINSLVTDSATARALLAAI